jgi:hypothetical protein
MNKAITILRWVDRSEPMTKSALIAFLRSNRVGMGAPGVVVDKLTAGGYITGPARGTITVTEKGHALLAMARELA